MKDSACWGWNLEKVHSKLLHGWWDPGLVFTEKQDAFLSILFFFFPLFLLCFEGVHFILIFNQGTGGPVEGSVYLFIQRADGAVGCYHNEKFNRPYLLPVREQESDADILQSLN